MEKKLYIITNCGDVVSIFENEEERSAEWKRLIETESHYSVTHYYYGTRTMTRGEYVCDKLCRYTGYALHHCQGGNERLGLNENEYFKYLIKMDCHKCPFKDYSPWLKETNEEEH